MEVGNMTIENDFYGGELRRFSRKRMLKSKIINFFTNHLDNMREFNPEDVIYIVNKIKAILDERHFEFQNETKIKILAINFPFMNFSSYAQLIKEFEIEEENYLQIIESILDIFVEEGIATNDPVVKINRLLEHFGLNKIDATHPKIKAAINKYLSYDVCSDEILNLLEHFPELNILDIYCGNMINDPDFYDKNDLHIYLQTAYLCILKDDFEQEIKAYDLKEDVYFSVDALKETVEDAFENCLFRSCDIEFFVQLLKAAQKLKIDIYHHKKVKEISLIMLSDSYLKDKNIEDAQREGLNLLELAGLKTNQNESLLEQANRIFI